MFLVIWYAIVESHRMNPGTRFVLRVIGVSAADIGRTAADLPFFEKIVGGPEVRAVFRHVVRFRLPMIGCDGMSLRISVSRNVYPPKTFNPGSSAARQRQFQSPGSAVYPSLTLGSVGSTGFGVRALVFSMRNTALWRLSAPSKNSILAPTSKISFFSGGVLLVAGLSAMPSAEGLNDVP